MHNPMTYPKTVLQMQKHVWHELKENPHFTKCPDTKHFSKWKDFKERTYVITIEHGMDGCYQYFTSMIDEWLEEVEYNDDFIPEFKSLFSEPE